MNHRQGLSQEAVELMLFIDNNSSLYRQLFIPIVKNLSKKKESETYIHAKAIDGFMYLIDAGAKDYAKEYGSPGHPWHKMFSLECRRALAKAYAKEFETEYASGNRW